MKEDTTEIHEMVMTPEAIEGIIKAYCAANGKTWEQAMIENDLMCN